MRKDANKSLRQSRPKFVTMKEARVSRKSAGKATPPRVSSPESRSLKESFSIGLTIVRKAIQRMGGRVGFESEPGKGSKFWIELPEIKAV